MDIASGTIEKIVQLIQQRYPGWSSFKDDRFLEEEITYKRNAVQKAQEMLQVQEIDRLIEKKDFDELKKRVERIAHSTNLLYVAVPLTGDMKVIYQKQLVPGTFWPQFRELLHGREESPERIEKFAGYLKSNDLPCSWTFTTYFPYLARPQSEIFLKPRTLKWFVEFLGQPDAYTKYPSASCYRYVQSACKAIIEKMAGYGATDMIDMQSMIWVIAATRSQDDVKKVMGDKAGKLTALFAQFEKEYWSLPQGKEHAAQYEIGRKIARENLALIKNALREGKDITDLVLLKLLPYNRNEANMAKGAWVHFAPAIIGELKTWFEAKGWAEPQDWPKIARAIFDFIVGIEKKPDDLDRICREFASLAYIKGFQTGMLTPMLSALNPDRFVLINNKSRKVLNYFTDNNFSQSIREYPQVNEAAQKFIGETRRITTGGDESRLHPNDLFDMFCHWLVAVAKHDFGKTNYWKIAPGENAWNWESCRNSGYIAIGWDEIGDISGMSKKEFMEKWRETAKKYPNWTDAAANQVWNFSRLAEGDKIVANNGTTKVLGLGTVTGEYFHVPGERHGHRVPVDWYDTNQREVEQGGWRKTMVKLTEKEFNEIEGSESGGVGFLSPAAFDLLAGLHQMPTYQFYQENQENIQRYIEKPIQKLLKDVIDQFSPDMLDFLETEKGLFSRIPKNDWGRGGAWDYYWGAVFPKGEKRTSNVQLFISINMEMLRYGFYISDSAEEKRDRFEADCKKHQNELKDIIEGILPLGTKIYGRIEGGTQESTDLLKECKIAEWLQSPGKFSFALSSSFRRETVLKESAAAITEKVFALFKALFPLVILAAASDPMAKIYKYVDMDDEKPGVQPEYSLATCAEDTGIEETQLDVWIRALTRKGQVVLYGPPGTGKTFMAERIARHLVGGEYGFTELVQFHPSYSYEDFIQGIRPQSTTDGKLEYPLVKGRFLEICQRAKVAKGKCVLIIDEINRANLSSVLGEMMYLLEYRNREIPLASGGKLQIPKNLFIIGTMNTADRSIALVDHALRRRFAFIPLMPNYKILKKFHEPTDFNPDGLIEVLKRLNRQIGDSHYEVGITFFLLPDVRDHLEAIWNMEIEPYLEEYFFDRRKTVDEYRWHKVKAEILSESE